MTNKFESDKLINSFLIELAEKGMSPMSIANYKSDLNSFEDWLTRKLKMLGVFSDKLTDCIAFINRDTGTEYKNYLIASTAASSSLNRKLSTLRKFSKFLLSESVLDFDFTNEIKNINLPLKRKLDLETLTREFREFLESEKVTKNTVKNYISDVKHFINWFNQNGGGVNE